MQAERRGRYLKIVIAVLYIAVILWSFTINYFSLFSWLLRVTGLVGMLSLSIAALMTPFLTRIRALFGASFLEVHHLFATLGIIFTTLHPVILALQTFDLRVFLPSFASLDVFLALAGRVALIFMYIGLAAILLRRRLAPNVWRPFHGLMYLVLLLGIIHAIILGTDFSDPFFFFLFNGLFAANVGAFLLKRWQRRPGKNAKTRAKR